jgi:hypothetical protein
MRRFLIVGLLLGLAAPGAAGGQAPDSGIAGRILAGPTCPVETYPPQPGCEPRPIAATLRIRPLGCDTPTIRVRSGTDGRFRVRLAPRTYVVKPLPRADSPFPYPPAQRRVRVYAGRFTFIRIFYDTGIR